MGFFVCTNHDVPHNKTKYINSRKFELDEDVGFASTVTIKPQIMVIIKSCNIAMIHTIYIFVWANSNDVHSSNAYVNYIGFIQN